MESSSEFLDTYNLKFIHNDEVEEISTILSIIDKLEKESKKSGFKSMFNSNEKDLIFQMHEQATKYKELREKL